MSVSELLQKRSSIRAYTKQPVASELLEKIFSTAQLSPSNCNVQPWQTYVLSGEAKDSLKQKLIAEVIAKKVPNSDFEWSIAYQGKHRERQFGSANALYSTMDIAREDKQARQMAMLRNWAFFDAPHVAIFTMDKYLGMTAATDVGIYAQTLTLLLEEQGISSCMQGALGQFPTPIHQALGLSDDQGVLFGMSFGYADETAVVNKTRTDRETFAQAVSFIE